MNATLRRCMAAISLVIFDVDGVLTDGRLYCDDDGGNSHAFNVRDGHGIRLLLHYGVQVAVLSGRDSAAVTRRMTDLGVEHVYQGCRDKMPAFEQLLKACGVSAGQTAYVGDDLPDIAPMRKAGLACAVADAHPEVIGCADWVIAANGGEGAARELCERLLKERGQWDQVLKYCCG